ncbi:pyrroline-5-carboxylate reductase protein [Rutstroemia sp. NJR-2017a WRK4]|nr:pyrroline-5-carboxylate reductase protein [Rutstroemia sp. NJR-2017a WRK4]
MASSPTDIMLSPKTSGLTLAIIGCGTMGTSILQGILNAKAQGVASISPDAPSITKFVACVNSMASVQRLRDEFQDSEVRVNVIVANSVQAMQQADIVLLACKPHMVDAILGQPGARDAVAGKLMISVLVGTPVDKMVNILTHGSDVWRKKEDISNLQIVRAMPNLAASFRESNTVVEMGGQLRISSANKSIVRYIFACVGHIVEVGPAQYDAASVLAAASLAFLTVAIDGILDGGVKEGIKRSEGRDILVTSLKGLVGLLEGKGGDRNGMKTGDEIREQFSSPRGTTIEGLVGLEEDRVRYAYCRSVMRATKRSLEM